MLNMDNPAPTHSVSIYVDYPDELVMLDNAYVDDDEIGSIVAQVTTAVIALIVESYLADIPIFTDRLHQLVQDVVSTAVTKDGLLLNEKQTSQTLNTFVDFLNVIVAPVVQTYVPGHGGPVTTALTDVQQLEDCLVLTIHY